MSKRNRPRTAGQAAHRRRRHEYRSAYNSPEGKAARGVAGGRPAAVTEKPAPAATKPAPRPAPKTPTPG